MGDDTVFAVHTTRPDDVGAVEIVFTDERAARGYARSRSQDWRVLSASVTRYTIAVLGSRHPVAWYRNGEEQHPRAARPDGRYYPTDGPTVVPDASGANE